MGNATDNFEHIDPLTTYSVTAHRHTSSSSRPALHKHTTNIWSSINTPSYIRGVLEEQTDEVISSVLSGIVVAGYSAG